MPEALRMEFGKNLADLAGLRRRALAYGYHLRETTLATVLRKAAELKLPRPMKSAEELRSVLQADLENHRAEMATPLPGQHPTAWKDLEQAIAVLEKSPEEFLLKCFTEVPDQASKGIFSVTSR